jgi:hypothetical protein
MVNEEKTCGVVRLAELVVSPHPFLPSEEMMLRLLKGLLGEGWKEEADGLQSGPISKVGRSRVSSGKI